MTKIDVKETMKKKPGEDFRPSIILGACNPPLAYSAISSAPEVGIKLPRNVTVEKTESEVLNSLANPEPMIMMGKLGENTALREIVMEARSRLERAAKTLRA